MSSTQMESVPAESLFTHMRFDLPAKALYVRFRDRGIESSWGRDVYLEHLRVWNNLKENNPPKEGASAYLASFDRIIDDMKYRRFDFNESPILVTPQRHVLNGGHRAAAAAYHGMPVRIMESREGGTLVDSESFKHYDKYVPGGLAAKWCDAIATEFCRYRPGSIYIVFLFPASKNLNQARHLVSFYTNVVYRKQINLTWRGTVALMKEIYSGEKWLGNEANGFKGAARKAKHCFGDALNMEVLLVTSDKHETILNCKESIRELAGVGNHSVHITDTSEETRRVANVVFNENSIHYLNTATPHDSFRTFKRYFGELKQLVDESGLDAENICVDGSSVLAAYGLRDAADIDVLHNESISFSTGIRKISSHNKEAGHYDTSLDDIIHNPCNHFWHDGIKFASYQVTMAMKSKRGEEKDVRDVRLLQTLKGGRLDKLLKKARGLWTGAGHRP